MDFKEYLKEEERVDELLAHAVLGAAKVAGGIGSTIARTASAAGRGLVGGAKAAGGAVKQFMVDKAKNKAKKKAMEKAGEVAQNTLGREDASRMYITKAGVKFIEDSRQRKSKPPTKSWRPGKHGAQAVTGRFLPTAIHRPTVPVPMAGPKQKLKP
jgi:hypothetical protein